MTIRAWSSPRVKTGGRYSTPAGVLVVDKVKQERVNRIDDADARRSGFANRGSLIEYLSKNSKNGLADGSVFYRVEFHNTGDEPEQPPASETTISSEEIDELSARLAKMDRLSRRGKWTWQTLKLIAANPRVPASKLAPMVGRETQPFKTDVRKLKRLGLTISLGVGYEISPRGKVFVNLVTEKQS